MLLPTTSEISHHHKVTNITMSPTSLSPQECAIAISGYEMKSQVNMSPLKGITNESSPMDHRDHEEKVPKALIERLKSAILNAHYTNNQYLSLFQ